MLSKLPKKVKVLAKPTVAIIVLLILFIVMGRFGLGRVEDIRAQIKKGLDDKNTLSAKLETLGVVEAGALEQANLALMVLPDENPILTVFSQIKTLSAEFNLTLSNLKGGQGIGESASAIGVSFDVGGEKSNVFAFIKEIQTMTPISLVSKFKFSQGAEFGGASINMNSFWAPLPTELPVVEQALDGFSPEEKEAIAKFAEMRPPTFFNLKPIINSQPRQDPFN